MVNYAQATKSFWDSTLSFVLTELETANAFADIALKSDDAHRASRNRLNARKAYDTALQFMRLLPDDDLGRLADKLDPLKLKLVELGEDL